MYDNLKEQLIYIQEQITDAVSYIYNINEIEELKPFTHSQKICSISNKKEKANYILI